MLILGIETATRNCSAALLSDNKIIHYAERIGKAIHSEIIPELILNVTENGKLIRELSAIAVSIGPGSYTGLRIGLATAKGLAIPFNTPILPVPTLAAMEYNARRSWQENLVLFIKSHRNLVYYVVADNSEFELYREINHNEFSNVQLSFPDHLFVGDSPELSPEGKIQECLPDAKAVAMLGYKYYDILIKKSSFDLEPEYHSEMEIKTWEK